MRFSTLLPLLALAASCGDPADPAGPSDAYPHVDRIAAIPGDVVKGTPENDEHPPVLHSGEFEEPAPIPILSTAGAEDSPFIPTNGRELYFFFAADVRQDPSVQVRDPVNGIWRSRLENGLWQEPELVWLQEPDVLALNGCAWVGGDEMLFCTVREGYAGMGWFRAEREGDRWANWAPAPFPSLFDVGELHIIGTELYFGSGRSGGAGGQDIWMSTRSGSTWTDPVNVAAVNTAADETLPYVTPDRQELWITRTWEGTPAVFRSRRQNGLWLEPELIVSRFAGEPTLDADGNLYFVHHFYRGGVMIEADIYEARRR